MIQSLIDAAAAKRHPDARTASIVASRRMMISRIGSRINNTWSLKFAEMYCSRLGGA